MSGNEKTFLYAPNVAINYQVRGHGPTVLVFLHGFAAALTTWDDLRDLFPVDRFTLYLLDLKGFGFSSKPDDGRYGLEDQAAIVTAFLEWKGLGNVVLVGHSLGGGIALITLLRAAAAGNTELIGRLVLIDSAAYPQRLPRLFRLLRLPLVGRFLLESVPVRWIVRLNLAFVYHDRSTMSAERIDRYVTCFSRKGISAVFIRTARQLQPATYADYIARYRTIALPTLVVWGDDDRVVAPVHGERLAREIPGARLIIISACGHNPHEERPHETYAAICSFLEETE